MASRLVRLETGSSSEAELAIRRQAWAPGRAETPAAAAAVRTTGVSSTTVASSESVVVTRAPSRNTPVNRGTGRSRPSLRTQPAAAAKTPARPQTSPTTRIVTRKSTTGPEVLHLLQEVVRGEGAGGQGRRRGHQADRRLGPAARVGVGRDQQCQEGRRRHDLGERRHRVNLRHL